MFAPSTRLRAAVLPACATVLCLPLLGASGAAAGVVAVPASSAAETLAGAAPTTGPEVAPPVRMPDRPRGLPAPEHWGKDLDDPAGYQPQLGCAAKAMPGIVRLRALALETYGRGGSSPASPRACTSGSMSEHKDGRAWDWMLDAGNRRDRNVAANFLGWLTGKGPSGVRGEMARRLGVMYVIYNRKIWSSYVGTWREYTGSDPHTSHIHVSLSWNGARAHTSFWTGRVWPTDYGPCQVFAGQPAVVAAAKPRTSPCPRAARAPRGSSLPKAWLGSSGDYVRRGQHQLGVTADGRFGVGTRNAVLRYQGRHDLPRTGALDKPTWASLRPASRKLNAPNWTRPEAMAWARHHGWPTLHRGSAGRAVYALQTALVVRDSVRNGYVGRRTAGAVIGFKRNHGLPANAIVNADVWAQLRNR